MADSVFHAIFQCGEYCQSSPDGFVGPGFTCGDLQAEVLTDGKALEDATALGDQTQPSCRAPVGCLFPQVDAVEGNHARRWPNDSTGRAQDCRFARSVRSKKRNDMAGTYLK